MVSDHTIYKFIGEREGELKGPVPITDIYDACEAYDEASKQSIDEALRKMAEHELINFDGEKASRK